MGEIVTKKRLAKIIGKTEKTILNWQKEGLPIERKEGKGKANHYDTAKVIDWLLKKQANRKISELEIERTRLVSLQANRQQIEINVLEGELLNSEDVLSEWSKALTEIKAKFLALPTRAATLLQGVSSVRETKKILDELIREVLGDLASGKGKKGSVSKPKAAAKT